MKDSSRDHAPNTCAASVASDLIGQDRSASGAEIRHGAWRIYFDPPPIATRAYDWHFVHDDFDASYEGPEDGWVGNGLAGHGSSPEDCLEQIADIDAERAL